jgi:hypothetical protein
MSHPLPVVQLLESNTTLAEHGSFGSLIRYLSLF